jgi:hypothetical protein
LLRGLLTAEAGRHYTAISDFEIEIQFHFQNGTA